ncbi:MAG: hypothetical protein C4K47_04815 [Candidatus Thorarchaeota archaeon]|nr:MAG: hypothetical protein C4K47_04815 [Candidatus Thorarchaeota archaeon]
MPNVRELKVELQGPNHGREWGVLRWFDSGPRVFLQTGEILEDTQNLVLILREEVLLDQPEVSVVRPLSKPIITRMKPLIMVRRGYEGRVVSAIVEDMYPPSSHGWASRLVSHRDDAQYGVQQVVGTPLYWLTIFDPVTGDILESHTIKSYELGMLTLEEDWEYYQSMDSVSGSEEALPEQARDLLDGPPPSWKAIANLTQGVEIAGLHRGKTMRDFTEQLVPTSFPPQVREEIMAFLAWVTKNRIPKRDPIELGKELLPHSLLRMLTLAHIQCRIDEVSPPEYVRIMREADSGQLRTPRKEIPETIRGTAWLVALHKITEQIPNWVDRVIDYAQTLDSSGRIQTRLPVSKSEARASVKAWGDRLAMLVHGLRLRAQVNPNALGLRNIVYVGTAHRWPHKHLEWTARLGFASEKPPYVHVMLMPPDAVERVRRARPTVVEIGFSARSINLGLYNAKRREWTVATPRILNSIDETRSLQRLENEFGVWRGAAHHPTMTEAKVLDLVSTQMLLSACEQDSYLQSMGVDRRTLQTTLTSLRDEGVVRLQYGINPLGVASLFTMAQGPPDQVCSLARAFLLHTPTAAVEMGGGGGKCFIMSRIPERSAHSFASSLEERASERGIELRCQRVSSYRGYMSTLYQRLLREDGTWNDDVDDLLSQIRLPPPVGGEAGVL